MAVAAGVPAPPLVEDSGRLGPRQRLRGPQAQKIPEEFKGVLTSVPTTVHDNGTVRFGDSLMLLNHKTEVLLQADISRQQRVVDDSHSQHKEFDAYYVTTGKVLHPCARNSFTVARADRKDGFGENLDIHYGQLVRILASNFLDDKILYLHLQEDPTSQLRGVPSYYALLLPRAAGRTLWRVVPAPLPPIDPHSRFLRAPTPPPVDGEVVRVNQRIWLENVETGRMLMSDLRLMSNAFGMECRVFARGANEREEQTDAPGEGDLRVPATWSFVNDAWSDAVEEARANLTGRQQWKEDEGDDYTQAEVKPRIEDPQALKPLEAYERKRLEDLHSYFSRHPKIAVCDRIFPLLRSRGVHFIRKMRKMCEEADVLKDGTLPARAFEGVLACRMVRLKHQEFDDLCAVFAAGKSWDDPSINYEQFLGFMEGIMCEERLDTVRRAYRRLCQASSGGFVNIETLMALWNPQCSREVCDGTMSKREAYQDFLSQWDAANADGHISPEEFLRYYRDVSMCYENTGEFVDMLKVAWDL